MFQSEVAASASKFRFKRRLLPAIGTYFTTTPLTVAHTSAKRATICTVQASPFGGVDRYRSQSSFPHVWFSSSSFNVAAAGEDGPSPKQNLVVRTLYRQLLRWCKATDENIPLGQIVPPIHIRAPEQVDSYRMENLAAGKNRVLDATDSSVLRARELIPKNTEIKHDSMTVPIKSSKDLEVFFRVIFRLNRAEGGLEWEPEHQKQRVSVAFEALKSLNELRSERIERIERRRKAHLDRTTENGVVKFRVGQVVQHKNDRWRGVIAGWDRTSTDSSSSSSPLSDDFGVIFKKKTSLTTKDYSDQVGDTNVNNVRYDVIIDEGDSHMIGSRNDFITNVTESEIMHVPDESLTRIRNHSISNYFARFDRETNTFIPNELKTYKYPLDVINDDGIDVRTRPAMTELEKKLCENVVLAAVQLARELDQIIVNGTLKKTGYDVGLLANVRYRLAGIVDGTVLPIQYRLALSSSDGDGISPSISASHYIRSLLHLCLEIFEVMYQRKLAIENKDWIRFKVGDIVEHKVFNFRGVVVAWDPKPTVDVTRWDGLQHIENPSDYPFYHVIPHQNDCINAFGGERPTRYVCEENLERCDKNRCLIDVDLDPGWKRSDDGNSFVPPHEVKFKYGETLDDDVTERCMTLLVEVLNRWQLDARHSQANASSVASILSLSNMYELLKIVDSVGDAIPVEEMIKEMRKAHADLNLRFLLDTGLVELLRGKVEDAIGIYNKAIEKDPNYIEAFNKLATAEFMRGKLMESLENAKIVMELDPKHFQALNGIGLICFEDGDYEVAIDCFRKSISMDPWSPVSSKLSLSSDLANQTLNPKKND